MFVDEFNKIVIESAGFADTSAMCAAAHIAYDVDKNTEFVGGQIYTSTVCSLACAIGQTIKNSIDFVGPDAYYIECLNKRLTICINNPFTSCITGVALKDFQNDSGVLLSSSVIDRCVPLHHKDHATIVGDFVHGIVHGSHNCLDDIALSFMNEMRSSGVVGCTVEVRGSLPCKDGQQRTQSVFSKDLLDEYLQVEEIVQTIVSLVPNIVQYVRRAIDARFCDECRILLYTNDTDVGLIIDGGALVYKKLHVHFLTNKAEARTTRHGSVVHVSLAAADKKQSVKWLRTIFFQLPG